MKSVKLHGWLVGLALVVVGATGWAQALAPKMAAVESIPAEISEIILQKLNSARPDFQYQSVQRSPMPGIYQVQVVRGPLLYVSGDGNFILDGTMYGVVAGGFVDMQELALKPKRKSRLDAVPNEQKVVFSPEGTPKAYIHVFTDVDCGYCRKLHQEVPELNKMGVEVRYLAFPRAGVGSASHHKIAAAWCAEDRQETMNRLKNLKPVDVPYCQDNPVADQYKLGSELGVRGTPAIFLADGSLLPGYLPAAELGARLGL